MAIRIVMLCLCIWLGYATSQQSHHSHGDKSGEMFDIAVYGATPAGITAAVAAARQNRTVLLLALQQHIGGMMTGGLSHLDLALGAKEVGGIAQEFLARVGGYYSKQPVRNDTQCHNLEPHVAERVYWDMLNQSGVTVRLNQRVDHLLRNATNIAQFVSTTDHTFKARYWIDASYEGDLLPLAGTDWTAGRESRAAYGEPDAGVVPPNNHSKYQFTTAVEYTDAEGNLLPLVESTPLGPLGSADKHIQAYCFRLCVTNNTQLKVPFTEPESYDPARWQLFRNLLSAQPDTSLGKVFAIEGPLGGDADKSKWDLNVGGPISTDYIGKADSYPTASWGERDDIIADHRNYTQELIWFLASDPAVPTDLQAAMNSFGYCMDEFVDSNYFPQQLYVREARRLVGDYVMTEHDRLQNLTKPDTVGLGSYNQDVHMTRTVIYNGTVQNVGWLKGPFPSEPFELPFRILLPKRHQVSNLLVPVAVSASHVVFGSIRLEATWSILGEAAGVAAALAASQNLAVQDVAVDRVQAQLESQGALLFRTKIHKDTIDDLCPNRRVP
eukprot:TRINITY_DN12490_c0_g2_i8.p2 TRINITY_DN12490_c0_g2~~TRINITY_DN12490_c0_g2_i8.p2  ORF type:complete len:554 (+),score=104.77 TRINITY_DN12490_c0_g2_i8:25-1686(+)